MLEPKYSIGQDVWLIFYMSVHPTGWKIVRNSPHRVVSRHAYDYGNGWGFYYDTTYCGGEDEYEEYVFPTEAEAQAEADRRNSNG